MNFVGLFSSAVIGVVLAIAGGDHLTRPHRLTAVLEIHQLLPRVTLWPVAVGLAVVESTLGLLLVASTLVQSETPILAACAACVFVTYAAYLTIVNARRPGAACGCVGPAAVVGRPVIVRALACAGLSLIAAFVEPNDVSAAGLTLVVEAALATSVLLLVLPAATAGLATGGES